MKISEFHVSTSKVSVLNLDSRIRVDGETENLGASVNNYSAKHLFMPHRQGGWRCVHLGNIGGGCRNTELDSGILYYLYVETVPSVLYS